MNPELQRQHEAHKARQARMRGPLCRAIVDPDVVRETIMPARRDDLMAAAKHQHAFRVACIRSYFDQQRALARSMMAAAQTLASAGLRDITRYETEALLGEMEIYALELAEARA